MPSHKTRQQPSTPSSFAKILCLLESSRIWPNIPEKPGHEPFRPLANEDGFILVAAIIILLVLVVLGITSNTTTNIELQIAGNDKVGKQTFYLADGATSLGSTIVEENLLCPNGFTQAAIGNITVRVPAFWQTTPADLTGTLALPDFGDADNDGTDDDGDGFDDRAFFYTPSADMQTNVVVAGTTEYQAGSAIQMTSGYEGTGKGGDGSAAIKYNIIAQGRGTQNSISEVEIIWLHVIRPGVTDPCNY